MQLADLLRRALGHAQQPGREVGRQMEPQLVGGGVLAQGAVRPHLGQRVSLEGAAAALAAHEARTSLGRSVVLMGE